jgi:tetratricopeptide (TPR) repeat protein
MRTAVLGAIFAVAVSASPAEPSATGTADDHYRRAVALREAIASTSNSVRIAMLAIDLRDALEKALALDPDHVPARIERIRYLVNAPAIGGGDRDRARHEATLLLSLDRPAGRFALGYIAYREKQFGVARKELRAAADAATTPLIRTESLQWLGWLSQESQQWDEAFATWDRLLAADPARVDALYEIGRTAAFCRCERERGVSALERYRRVAPTAAKRAEGVKLLKRLK